MTNQKEIINSILKKEIIKEFEQKKLGDLIIYFIAKYPDYPYFHLPIEKLDEEYLSAYDIPFLASYIRYSDITLLQCGIRATEIREKLYFLHQQIGTISARYRNFIWSDLISIDDLKRWTSLLKQHWIKEYMLRNIIITESLKTYLDQCLNPNSYAFQILQMIQKRYPNECVGIFNILEPKNYESFYKLLKILECSSEEILFSNLMACFNENRELLSETPLEELLKNRSKLLIKLRESYGNINQEELNEKNLEDLKNFFTKIFLGMSYAEFEAIFPKITPSEDDKYALLEQLYETRFPIVLTQKLYAKFKQIGDFRIDLEPIIASMKTIRNFNLQKSAFSFGPNAELITLHDSSFIFITMSLKDYEQKCIKKREKFVDTTIQNDLFFNSPDDCMIAFEDITALSYEERHCIVRGKELVPKAIVAIDTISFADMNIKKILGLPIILIDRESYAKRNFEKLNQLLEKQDWKLYIERKRMLFELLKDQSWLLLRYFETGWTVTDVDLLRQSFEEFKPHIPQDQLEYYQSLLIELANLNEQIEMQIKKQEKGTISYIKRGEKNE